MTVHPSVTIHPAAIVEPGATIGADTRVWAFTHILPKASIGSNCNICDHVFIENQVIIGNRVTIKSGVQLWDGIYLDDDVFIGPNATFTNDRFPRSKQYPDHYLQTRIGKGASIGANATILPGITVGQSAMVGAGAVVTNNVPPYAVVVGNPAHIIGYVDVDRFLAETSELDSVHVKSVTVSRVELIDLGQATDLRGTLTFGEVNKHLPFQPKRFFVQSSVPTTKIRGEHAHRELHQIILCLSGRVAVVVDDGLVRQEFKLTGPRFGIYTREMVWTTLYDFSPDAVVLVLASDVYDATDYIRDYEEFRSLVKDIGG